MVETCLKHSWLLLQLPLGLLLGFLATPGPPLVSWSPSTQGMLESNLRHPIFCKIYTRAATASSAILASGLRSECTK